MEKMTYTIEIDNCECVPSIVAKFEHVPEDRVKKAVHFAVNNFRQVKVLEEQTGRIMMSNYVDDDWFTAHETNVTALDYLKYLCYNK